MTLSRIEGMGRAENFAGGLAARVADPLWMLGRQWQFGELTGDDAAQPAAVRVTVRHAPLASYAGGDDPLAALSTDRPLERLVEESPRPAAGHAGRHAGLRSGARLRARLLAAGHGAAVTALTTRFGFGPPSATTPLLTGAPSAIDRLLQRRALDGGALLAAPRRTVREALEAGRRVDVQAVLVIFDAWRADHESVDSAAWQPRRFEHRFRVVADDAGAGLTLRADEHDGRLIDWHSFDLDPTSTEAPVRDAGAADARSTTVIAVATPVRFAGMPASRWWEFEDAEVSLGDLDAGAADLARLSVAEFATVYNDDWFVVPLRVRRGSLVRIESLEVVDTMGRRAADRPKSARRSIPAASQVDAGQGGVQRPWRFFELSGDPHVAQVRSPWVLIAPALASTLHGRALERVVLARDEDANLAWAIERVIEGPLGRPLDRARDWAGHQRGTPAEGAPDAAPGVPRRYADQYWRYDLETSPPPWWIPMIPQRVDASSPEIRLRRARMATWSEHDAAQVGPKGELLEPHRPFSVYEEEVPRSGTVVERSWQWARSPDGAGHLWLQRSKRNGRGERSSGLGWDVLHREFGQLPE